MLIENGHKVDVASNIAHSNDRELQKLGCEIYHVPFQRSPIKLENIEAYKQIKKLIIENNYDIVHTHTPIASAIARFACKSICKTKVFYTAHGFHFYNGAPIINWLVYYPIEKYLSKYTDVLITINKEDYNRAKKLNAKKLFYIHGVGIDINKFRNIKVDRAIKRKEIGLPNDSFVLLSVGELNKNKHHEIIIKALAELKNPNIYYVICGQGPLEYYLKSLSKKLNIESQVILLGFREDVNEIYKIADVFVFPSYREGLPVSLLEALASGLPVICSDIRGNIDLVENGINGYLVRVNDINGYAKAIEKMRQTHLELMETYNNDKIKYYDISNVTLELKKLYESFCC